MVSRSLSRAARAATAAAIVTTGGLAASAAVHSAPVHAAGTVTIGVVADLTGSGAAYGISIANGAKLAGTLLGKSGGVNGAQVKVVVDDGATNTSQIINIFQQDAGAKHVLVIVGPTLSQEAFQADHVAQGLSVPVVATSNTAPGIPQIGNYIFRLGLGEAAVVPLAMKTALKHLQRAFRNHHFRRESGPVRHNIASVPRIWHRSRAIKGPSTRSSLALYGAKCTCYVEQRGNCPDFAS